MGHSVAAAMKGAHVMVPTERPSAVVLALVRFAMRRGEHASRNAPPGSTTTEYQSKVGGCCPPGMFYDPSSGHCLKSTHCPKWLDAYGGKCLPHCAPGMRRNLDGKCVARCTAGLECGAACCPAGQQCARPAAPVVGQQQPKCCPQGQVCGPLCMDDLQYIGAHCCGSGPAAGWAREGQECCGAVPCGPPNRLPR